MFQESMALASVKIVWLNVTAVLADLCLIVLIYQNYLCPLILNHCLDSQPRTRAVAGRQWKQNEF